MRKKEIKAIEDFKDAILKKFKDKILLIELFGSKIRGKTTKGSDIDLLVVYKGNGKIKKSLINLEWEILKKYDYTVYLSGIFYSLKEYERDFKLQTPFIYNVEREGIILWNTLPKRKS